MLHAPPFKSTAIVDLEAPATPSEALAAVGAAAWAISSAAPGEVHRAIVRHAYLIPGEVCVALPAPGGDDVALFRNPGISADVVAMLDGAVREAIHSRQPLLWTDAHLVEAGARGHGALVVYPFVVGSEAHGAIAFLRKATLFLQDELTAIATFAAVAGLACARSPQ